MPHTNDNPHLDAAIEVLMAYIQEVFSAIDREKAKPDPNIARIEALVEHLNNLMEERYSIKSESIRMINRVLYIYAPFLKHFREIQGD